MHWCYCYYRGQQWGSGSKNLIHILLRDFDYEIYHNPISIIHQGRKKDQILFFSCFVLVVLVVFLFFLESSLMGKLRFGICSSFTLKSNYVQSVFYSALFFFEPHHLFTVIWLGSRLKTLHIRISWNITGENEWEFTSGTRAIKIMGDTVALDSLAFLLNARLFKTLLFG